LRIKIINKQIAEEILIQVPNEITEDIHVDPDEKYYTVNLIDRQRLLYADPNFRKLH
tara:strand:+ start:2234 stop:2404 length:171 start_codon:yes stop_codon:yes gene_type:complete